MSARDDAGGGRSQELPTDDGPGGASSADRDHIGDQRDQRSGPATTVPRPTTWPLRPVTSVPRGHAAGDELLNEVVETIRLHLRSYDLIVRYGATSSCAGLPPGPTSLDPAVGAGAAGWWQERWGQGR